MSPEVLKAGEYDEACDVFSFAILMYELFFEKDPYHISMNGLHTFDNMWNLGQKIANEFLRPTIPDDLSEFSQKEIMFLELMQKCWSHDPQERPLFDEISTELDLLCEIAPHTRFSNLW